MSQDPGGFVTHEDVAREANLIETVKSWFGIEDDFQAAILTNTVRMGALQRQQLQTLRAIAGETPVEIPGEDEPGVASFRLQDRRARVRLLQQPAGDISEAVSTRLLNNDSFTLYLTAEGSVDIDVLLSPDGGNNMFTPNESPITFGSSGDNTTRFTYDANYLELQSQNSNTTNVLAIVREII